MANEGATGIETRERPKRPVFMGVFGLGESWVQVAGDVPGLVVGVFVMAPGDQGGELVRLHKHAGKTPEARRRQVANLRPQAPLKHGAYSADKLAPERERILAELVASFPGVRRDRLELAAGQRARIVLLQAYVDVRGLIAHRGRGTSPPAVAALRQEEAAYRQELTKIEDLHREAAPGAGHALAAIEQELADDHGRELPATTDGADSEAAGDG